ncbi:hypothetical protein L615_004400000050 [Nocardioides sp. J9]|uniref:hypothetical protein n=1 Tax=Nocardioides sp. J9 TaxID=935844 RepID=UPI0011A54508|nr:hypothetical protein [Nocardioides sp. J9]TWG96241.1 hypothetical protein L615_004400000050 [Nocardioides sp. J9]
MNVKLALPAALLAVLSLSACGDDESPSASDPTPETTSETPSEPETELETETEETEGTDSGDAPLSGDVTAPGTELSIGDTAILPVTYGTNGQATLEVTVTGIEEGTSADLEAAKVKNAADYTPFYIQMEMKILDANDDFGSYGPGSDFDGLTGSSKAGSLIVFGDFEPCNDDAFEYDSKVGDTATTCVPALTTKGSVVDGVQFSGGTDEYDQFDGKPVVWK